MNALTPAKRKLGLGLGLTLFVLWVHLYLLGSAPLSLSFGPPSTPQPFVTRTVVNRAQAAPPQTTKLAPLTDVRPRSPKRPATALAPLAAASDTPVPAGSVALASATPAASADSLAPEPVAQVSAAPRGVRELSSPTGAVRLPGAAWVKYKVEANKFPYSAQGELLWQQDGQQYKARLAFSAFGQTRAQTSTGQITPEGLAPIRFADKYRSEVAAHFNRAQGRVTFSANTPDAPLLVGAQDRLSVMLQLAALIGANPTQFAPATTVTLQVVSAREADTWLWTVGEEEALSLAGGVQPALKLVRNPRQPFDQKVELWLGTQLDYLPVRLRVTDANGDFIDQKWLSIELPSKPSPLD